MDHLKLLNQVMDISVEHWNKNFGGTSALDICDKVGASNEEVMAAMEILYEQGKGSLNRSVELYPFKIDPEKPKLEIPDEPTTTHVFFPDKKVLTDNFYSSILVRENFPEYKNRLHQGAHQLELIFFSDEVLLRYFDHPEFYAIDDSLSGGHIGTKGDAPDNRNLYVRYGKRKIKSGRTAVAAIFKDLYVMSAEEQRHWHSYEIEDIEADQNDPNFARFLARTYEGAWVNFPNPIKDISEVLDVVNQSIPIGNLFKRIENVHLRLPVENTKKALYDCCSEFYKLIGPDSLDQRVMKNFLFKHLGASEEEFIHPGSGRPLSSMQLLALIESKAGIEKRLTAAVKAIGKYRIKANHKLTDTVADEENYVDIFISLCEELSRSGGYFAHRIQQEENT
jgi:hypothetical protein